jgi:hypothetical protein
MSFITGKLAGLHFVLNCMPIPSISPSEDSSLYTQSTFNKSFNPHDGSFLDTHEIHPPSLRLETTGDGVLECLDNEVGDGISDNALLEIDIPPSATLFATTLPSPTRVVADPVSFSFCHDIL